MAPDTAHPASRFKSRFSIFSLLPPRHPPLSIYHPRPVPPPTRQVPNGRPVVVEEDISPVHSEYPTYETPSPPSRAPPSDNVRNRVNMGMASNVPQLRISSFGGNDEDDEGPSPCSRYPPSSCGLSDKDESTGRSPGKSVETSPWGLFESSYGTPRSRNGGEYANASSHSSPRSNTSPPRRPPPLDLTRTKEAFPCLAGVIPTAGIEYNVPVRSTQPTQSSQPSQTTGPSRPGDTAQNLTRGQPDKKTKTRVPVSLEDPFDVVEIEPGHRYTLWKGGRISSTPGQIIPRGTLDNATPTIRGKDPTQYQQRHHQHRNHLDPGRSTMYLNTPEPYDSVLHNILLTPAYSGHSPIVSPTRSHDWEEDGPTKRRTLFDAVKRSLTWLRGGMGRDGSEEGGREERSARELKAREAREMARYRPDRIGQQERFVTEDDVGYSTNKSPAHVTTPCTRRSPGYATSVYTQRCTSGYRERNTGVWNQDGKFVKGSSEQHGNGKKEEARAKRRKRIWKVGDASWFRWPVKVLGCVLEGDVY